MALQSVTLPAERFEREYGCTEVEWRRWMPAATQGRPAREAVPGRLEVQVGPGRLVLTWSVLSPRRIALVQLPRLHVRFEFLDVPVAERLEFMRVFDLHLQRGGG